MVLTSRRLRLAPVLIGTSLSVSACVPLGGADAGSSSTSGTVVAVVDGDTIDVDTGAGAQRVRIIGIDTPEIGRGGKADECYAREAREILDELIYRSDVELIADPTQADDRQHARDSGRRHHYQAVPHPRSHLPAEQAVAWVRAVYRRSRGGLSTKIHQLVDGNGLALVTLITPGQAEDSPMFLPLMAQLRVGRDAGRPRTRPDAVRADKAYSSRAIRAHLRSRGRKAVIPEPDDQKGHRKRRGLRGGRPVSYNPVDYKNRNVIERGYCRLKQWRGLATRYDKHAVIYRAAVVLNAVIAWAKALSDTP